MHDGNRAKDRMTKNRKNGARRTFAGAALLLALAVPGTLHADVAPPRPSPSPPVVGGFHELRPSDPELAAVAAFVVPRLGRRNARLGQIIGGEKQVVAGANYRIMLQLTDGSRWRAEVWKKLDGTMVMKRFGAVG